MKIFITGATGYLGNNLANRLAAEGHTIHALCRNADAAKKILHPSVKIFEGDITDKVSVEKAISECEQAYHLAAYARVWAKDMRVYERLNLDATKIILDAALHAGVQKTVFTSTGGVLGPSGETPVKEDDKRIGNVMNEYEDSKTKAGQLCKDYCNKYSMHIVIVNPPRIYGPGIATDSNAVTKLVRLYLQGKWKFIPGDGNRTGSYVYVDDIINGHILAMKYGRSGERYILSGVNASYNEFFKTLAEVTGKKVKLYHLPVWLMMAAGYIMLAHTKLTGKPPLLTPVWIKKYLYNWSLDCSKAQRELGYTYISLKEGLQKTVDWIKEKDGF